MKVEFNQAVDKDKAKIEVKRGTVKPNVKEIKFADDNKSATIEFNAKMIAGDYSVTVTGLTEEALKGSVKVEAEKLTNIEFLSDIAVISGNNITTSVVATNQYGEEVNSKLPSTTVSSSKGLSGSVDNKGILTVVGNTDTHQFKVDDKVVVTIVDAETGVTATKTLTVAKAAAVESITVGELTTDDKELAEKALNVSNYTNNVAKYYLPVEVKDQYGNKLKASDLNSSVTVASSNKEIVNPASTVFVQKGNDVVVEFQAAPNAQAHGTAVLTFVAASTGKTATASITIKEDAKLDVVTLEGASLVQNVATELPVSIVNTYGEEVDLFDVTVGGSGSDITLDTDTTIKATNGTFTVERDYINKTAKLKITPTDKNVTVQVVSATGKPQVLTLTAEAKPTVSAIKGLDEDFVSLLANDNTLTTDLKSAVEFVDQYGNDIDAPTFDVADNSSALDFTIKEKDSNNTVTSLSNGVVQASTTAGTEVYEIILKDKDNNELDKLEVTIGVLDANKLTQFEIDDLNKFYTHASTASTAASDYNQTLEIYGVSNGKTVKVNQSMIKDVHASNGLLGFNGPDYTTSDVDTKDKDIASTLTVIVANDVNTFTLTKDVVYSSAAPVAQSLITKYDGKTVTDVVQVPVAELNKAFTGDSKLNFVAKDQYGVAKTTGHSFLVTNNSTAGAVNAIGVGSGFTNADVGKSFVLTVRVDGKTTQIKVVVE